MITAQALGKKREMMVGHVNHHRLRFLRDERDRWPWQPLIPFPREEGGLWPGPPLPISQGRKGVYSIKYHHIVTHGYGRNVRFPFSRRKNNVYAAPQEEADTWSWPPTPPPCLCRRRACVAMATTPSLSRKKKEIQGHDHQSLPTLPRRGL